MTAAEGDPYAHGRFVRHLQLRLERLDGENAGKMRVSSPQARGWAATVLPHPDALWEAIREAFTEATVAGYARWQGAVYDHDALTERDDPTEPKRARGRPDPELMLKKSERRAVTSWSRHSVTRPDSVDPADWTPLPDGRWRGPAGRAFRSDALQVVRMLRKRAQLGLALSYDEHVARTGDDDCGEDAQ